MPIEATTRFKLPLRLPATLLPKQVHRKGRRGDDAALAVLGAGQAVDAPASGCLLQLLVNVQRPFGAALLLGHDATPILCKGARCLCRGKRGYGVVVIRSVLVAPAAFLYCLSRYPSGVSETPGGLFTADGSGFGGEQFILRKFPLDKSYYMGLYFLCFYG